MVNAKFFYSDLSRQNLVALTRDCVLRPWGWRTAIAQYLYMEQENRVIFESMSNGKFLYSVFISAKFSCANARVSFAAVGVGHQNREIHNSGALKSYDFLNMGEAIFCIPTLSRRNRCLWSTQIVS